MDDNYNNTDSEPSSENQQWQQEEINLPVQEQVFQSPQNTVQKKSYGDKLGGALIFFIIAFSICAISLLSASAGIISSITSSEHVTSETYESAIFLPVIAICLITTVFLISFRKTTAKLAVFATSALTILFAILVSFTSLNTEMNSFGYKTCSAESSYCDDYDEKTECSTLNSYSSSYDCVSHTMPANQIFATTMIKILTIIGVSFASVLPAIYFHQSNRVKQTLTK